MRQELSSISPSPIMFTWRLYYGALEMRQTSEQISAFVFYRWWTIPFDIFCMIILIFAILYTFVRRRRRRPNRRASRRPALRGARP